MSRVRPIEHDDEQLWFDVKKSHLPATDDQLEWLVIIEDIDIDDVLDAAEDITQGDVLYRLRKAKGILPEEEIERRKSLRHIQRDPPKCKICGRDGDSTKHHFVNKWILRELDKYQQRWADRNKNCIPVCITCHRALHSRKNGVHSIVQYLSNEQLGFAERAITALASERPNLLILIARGDRECYEVQLVHDWLDRKFQSEDRHTS